MENCSEQLEKFWPKRKIAVGRTLSSGRSLPHWTQEQFWKSAKLHANDFQFSSQTPANTYTCQEVKAASASRGQLFFLIVTVNVHVCLQKLKSESLIYLRIVCQPNKESADHVTLKSSLYRSGEKAIKSLKTQQDIKAFSNRHSATWSKRKEMWHLNKMACLQIC